MLHPIQRLFVPPLLKLIWIKEITGRENLPSNGRFIITPNHQSILDDWIPSCIIVPLLDRELHMYVNRKFFKNLFFRWYLHNHKAIPVEVYDASDKKEVNEKAFKAALSYLGNNEPICIYPEGHRSKDGELQKAKYGAANLALAARVPVVPVGFIGTREVLPKEKTMPSFRKIIKVKIGKPIYFDEYYGKQKDKKSLEEVTRRIMHEVGKLINKKYRH